MAKPPKSDGSKLKGASVLICTVTRYYTGIVTRVTKSWIHLEKAAWIPDTGRFHDALVNGKLGEVEPYPGWVRVARGAIVEVCPWEHEPPVSQR